VKILFIGEGNRFSAQLMDRLVKEGNEVCLISRENFTPTNKPKLKYAWYDYPADSLSLERVFFNVKPNQVIFAGDLFGDLEWHYDAQSTRYLGELLNVLNLSVKHHIEKFIMASSTDVYALTSTEALTEHSELNPTTYKGLLLTQAEALVREFHDQHRLPIVIVRFGDLYGYPLDDHRHDFLSERIRECDQRRDVVVNSQRTYNPVHLNDAVEALFRCTGNTPSDLYNVASNQALSALSVIQAVQTKLGTSVTLITEDGPNQTRRIDAKRIKSELEWTEFHTFAEALEALSVQRTIADQSTQSSTPSTFKINPVILHLIENVVFFGVVVALTELFKNHSVLKNIDLMTLYIISIALFFGIRQSILSIILTFAYYLMGLQLGLGNFVNVVLNADTFLKLAQYIFVGVVVGYTVDQFKTSLAQLTIEKEFLDNEYQELKAINDDNVMIKHHYEKRLISYKTSLPRLYAITNRLDSLDPEVLFSSIITVLVDVLETDSVSVYTYDTKSGYARLIGAKSDDAVFMAKSFKLSDYPEMEQKLINNDIFVGDQWANGSPAMAGPIFHKGSIIAVILIKSLRFESLNLYQINLLRTLTALISSSFIRAYQYEEKVRNEKVLPGTEILKTAAFRELLELKRHDKEQAIAQYTLLRLVHTDDAITTYRSTMNLFRSTDVFGVDSQSRLHVLLRSTSEADLGAVEARLNDRSLRFDVIDLSQLA
jgi:nucleoside-diphosphate-sugar epimerase